MDLLPPEYSEGPSGAQVLRQRLRHVLCALGGLHGVSAVTDALTARPPVAQAIVQAPTRPAQPPAPHRPGPRCA